MRPLRHRPGDGHLIDAGLQRVAFSLAQVGGSRDIKHGRLIFECVGDRSHHVGESRTGGDESHAQTPSNPRIGFGGEPGGTLVSHIDQANRSIRACPEESLDMRSMEGEYGVHSASNHGGDHRIPARDLRFDRVGHADPSPVRCRF